MARGDPIAGDLAYGAHVAGESHVSLQGEQLARRVLHLDTRCFVPQHATSLALSRAVVSYRNMVRIVGWRVAIAYCTSIPEACVLRHCGRPGEGPYL